MNGKRRLRRPRAPFVPGVVRSQAVMNHTDADTGRSGNSHEMLSAVAAGRARSTIVRHSSTARHSHRHGWHIRSMHHGRRLRRNSLNRWTPTTTRHRRRWSARPLLWFVPNQPCDASVHQKELFHPASPDVPCGSFARCAQVPPKSVVFSTTNLRSRPGDHPAHILYRRQTSGYR